MSLIRADGFINIDKPLHCHAVDKESIAVCKMSFALHCLHFVHIFVLLLKFNLFYILFQHLFIFCLLAILQDKMVNNLPLCVNLHGLVYLFVQEYQPCNEAFNCVLSLF